MQQLGKKIATGALCISAAFTAVADMGETRAGTTKAPAEDTSIAAWYDKIRPLSFLRNAEEQCVPVARLKDAANKALAREAKHILEIMDRTEMTKRGADALRAQDGAMCLVDFKKEYNEGVTAGAMYFPDYNAVLINLAAPEGCRISASIHELHHSAQKKAGFTAPVRDLNLDEQENYIIDIEADAHVIQTIGSWMLAQPQFSAKPYARAFNCLKEDPDKNLPYLAQAAEKLEALAKENPDAARNGQAARQLYADFSGNETLNQRYRFAVKDMYVYDPYREINFHSRYTMKDLNIDTDGLGKIHYPQNYRALPLKPAG